MTARTRQRPTPAVAEKKVETPAVAEKAETPAVAEEKVETPAVTEETTETPAVAEEKAETPAVAEEETETMDANGATPSDPFAALNALPDAEEVTEFRRGPAAVDYEKLTPLRIKTDLLKAYNAFEPAKDNEGNVIETKPGKSKWFTQAFPTTDMALQYQDLATKYAKFRGWTFRSKFMEEVNGVMVATKEKVPSKVLRFTAKPKEVRAGAGNHRPRVPQSGTVADSK